MYELANPPSAKSNGRNLHISPAVPPLAPFPENASLEKAVSFILKPKN
jgi:hypothetical protein